MRFHPAVYWIVTFVVAAMAGCQKSAPPPAVDPKLTEKVDDLSRKIDELKSLLADLKDTKATAEDRYRTWLGANLIPGKTTLHDVKSIFGPAYLDLDRPERDDVLTIQYPVGDMAGRKLVLDFCERPQAERTVVYPTATSVDSKLLTNFEFNYWICGYCPHVLIDDGQWRLEGKMLPGAIGVAREQADVLVLPRAKVRAGAVHIKLANWAPETEYLDHASLGVCEAADGEELDFDVQQTAYLWRSKKRIDISPPQIREGKDCWRLDAAARKDTSFLALELRNTETFQEQTRRFHTGEGPSIDAALQVCGGSDSRIAPVGTKLFRRVIVPVAKDAPDIELTAPAGMWWIRRAWFANGRVAQLKWLAPTRADGATESLSAIKFRDGSRLRLQQNEETALTFIVPASITDRTGSLRFALQLSGYYEFAPESLKQSP
jgi:hypothetical protein